MDQIRSKRGDVMEQKIKQDFQIGKNIRKLRKANKLGQTDLVRMLQIDGCDMTRECLVKIDEEGNGEFNIGDGGIISILIAKEDFKNEHFENAVVYWDCY